MSNSDDLEILKNLWIKVLKNSLIKQEHLYSPSFHSVVGTYSSRFTRFVWGKSYVPPRINPFLLGRSGTGKGQLMKSETDLINDTPKDLFNHDKFGNTILKANYFFTTTEASLVGSETNIGLKSVQTKTGGKFKTPNIFVTKGLLQTHNLLCWSEASDLFRKEHYYASLVNALRVALDEPGIINKDLKFHGKISYRTDATVMTGSMYINEISETIMKTGLFQRFYLVYVEPTEEEIIDVQYNLWDLLNKDYLQTKQDEKEFYDKLEEITTNWLILYETIKNDYHFLIPIRKDIIDEIKPLSQTELFNKYFINQFKEPYQTILQTFYSRVPILVTKLAVQKAICNGDTEVDLTHFKTYGIPEAKLHCESVLDLLKFMCKEKKETIKITRHLTYEEREKFVISLIRQKGSVDFQTLVDALQKFRDYNEWDLGISNTEEFINGLIDKNKIKSKFEGLPGGGKKKVITV